MSQEIAKLRTVGISFPHNTYKRVLAFAEHIDCVSLTGEPVASVAVRKVLRVILKFYDDPDFQRSLEIEGLDALAFIQRCVKRGMKQTLEAADKKVRRSSH